MVATADVAAPALELIEPTLFFDYILFLGDAKQCVFVGCRLFDDVGCCDYVRFPQKRSIVYQYSPSKDFLFPRGGWIFRGAFVTEFSPPLL
jgi:hypothetical protein